MVKAVAAGLLSLVLGLPAATSPVQAPARVAEELLAAVVLPPGARPARGAAPPGALAQAPETPAGQHLVDVHGFWVLPESPDSVVAWAEASLPSGLAFAGSGAEYQGARLLARFVTGSLPVPPPGIWGVELTFSAAPLPGGRGSFLRVDAQVGGQPRGRSTIPPEHGPRFTP